MDYFLFCLRDLLLHQFVLWRIYLYWWITSLSFLSSFPFFSVSVSLYFFFVYLILFLLFFHTSFIFLSFSLFILSVLSPLPSFFLSLFLLTLYNFTILQFKLILSPFSSSLVILFFRL